ncbi:MAG: hypothetical protein RL641_441 [Candidatus Parcubacteria bacterium]|jgi:hypothetical protein
MEKEPTIESPELVTERFTKFVKEDLANGMAGGVMWRTEMSALFGDEEMLRDTKDEIFRGDPELGQKLADAYRNGGMTKMKACFIEKLYQATDAKNLGGVNVAIEQIIDFH